MRFSLVLSLILSILVAVFALLNTAEITVNFGFIEASGPIALVVILSFVLGVAVGALAMVPGRMKRRKELKALKKRLNQLSQPETQTEPHGDRKTLTTPPPPPYTAPHP